MPHASAKTTNQKAEETRLAYVALTRAGSDLTISWSKSRNGRSASLSPFLEGMPNGGRGEKVAGRPTTSGSRPRSNVGSTSLLEELDQWRATRARRSFQNPDEVCSLEELREIAATSPTTEDALAKILGPLTAHAVASEVLELVGAFRERDSAGSAPVS